MKLIRVEGNIRLQRALSHSYVQTIVDIMLQHQDTLGFVAEVLQKYM